MVENDRDEHDRIATLISRLRANPAKLYDVPPGDFELVVAELLAAQNWKVSVSSRTREGGRDLLAVSEGPAGFETAWAVECKRYARERKVGVAAVRQLLGSQRHFGIPKALLVTTSSFSREARECADAAGDLHLADHDQLTKWIANYALKPGRRPFAETNRFCSCFVSYSHFDEEFVERLVSRLRGAGVRVWYAPEDLVPGTKLDEAITTAIRTFDKLLVVLSVNSMNSQWVKSEIRKARRREVAEKRRILFPITIVSFDEVRMWQLFDADLGDDLAAELRQYFIPDLANWRHEASFEIQFAKILKGLHTETAAA